MPPAVPTSSVDSLAMGIKKMQVNIADAARGGKAGQRGIGRRRALRRRAWPDLLPEEQFRRIADRIAAIENPTERAAAAVKIFGRNGTELMPMLLQGADGIAKWEARARALGIGDEQRGGRGGPPVQPTAGRSA